MTETPFLSDSRILMCNQPFPLLSVRGNGLHNRLTLAKRFAEITVNYVKHYLNLKMDCSKMNKANSLV